MFHGHAPGGGLLRQADTRPQRAAPPPLTHTFPAAALVVSEDPTEGQGKKKRRKGSKEEKKIGPIELLLVNSIHIMVVEARFLLICSPPGQQSDGFLYLISYVMKVMEQKGGWPT